MFNFRIMILIAAVVNAVFLSCIVIMTVINAGLAMALVINAVFTPCIPTAVLTIVNILFISPV